MSKRNQVSDSEDSSSDVSLIDICFDFFSPNPDVDYHAIKRLLVQLFGRDAELFHTHEFTELILSQPKIGTTIKTDGEESDPYALLTVLNLHIHHEHPSIKALAQYLLSKASEAASSSSETAKSLHSTLESLFSQSEKHVGLVICERLINMPVQVIPPMHNMLKDEVRGAIAENLPYKFSHLLFLSRTYHLSSDEESALANSLPASQARKKKTKTKKRRPDVTNEADQQGSSRPEDGIYPFHPEDAVISQLSTHTLNYSYTSPPTSLQQETRGKDAFGLDVRGRLMLLDLSATPSNPNVMDTDDQGTKDAWDVLTERLNTVYGV